MVLCAIQRGEGVENHTNEIEKKLKLHIHCLENTINNPAENELTI